MCCKIELTVVILCPAIGSYYEKDREYSVLAGACFAVFKCIEVWGYVNRRAVQ